MAKKAKAVITSDEQNRGEVQDRLALTLAENIEGVAAPIITHLADIKAEYEGGPFVVFNTVLNFLPEDQRDALPEPHTKTGNNPAWYKVRQVRGKNETVKEVYFYDRVAEKLPTVRRALVEIDQLNRSMGDPSKVNMSDIPDTFKAMPIANRIARVNRLRKIVTTAKTNVGSAFELYFQLKAFDALNTVTVSICYALDETGAECDGQDGREYKVEETSTPIRVMTTVKGRMGTDYKDMSVATFKRIDVEKAKEAVGGPTFAALMKTLEKGPDAPVTEVTGATINTLQTLVTTVNNVSLYLHNLQEQTSKAGWEAVQKYAEADDKPGDTEHADFFYNLGYIYHSLRGIVDNPRAQVRYQAELNKRAEKPLAKAS